MTSVMSGNPATVGATAQTLLLSAPRIVEAADELARLTFGQGSRATEALEGSAARLVRDLAAAHRRYLATAQALKTYADELTQIQAGFRSAEADLRAGAGAGAQADTEIVRLTRTIEAYEAANAPVAIVTQLSDELRSWQVRARSLSAALGQAEGLLRSADQQLEDAAQRAIASIDAGREPEAPTT